MADRGIPVMGHLGLTPQSVHLFGGYKVQGRTDEQAVRISCGARSSRRRARSPSCSSACPSALAAEITASLSIPTIGIGAGPDCDAQVLVVHDLLGLTDGPGPKFVKRYANVRETITEAARRYAEEVSAGVYPDEDHSYS